MLLVHLFFMQFTFYKYQGTGNDFIIIDNRTLLFPKEDTKTIAQMCDRRFGIGADGLLLFENHDDLDFKMVYYNADGYLGSMCGNGGRCMVHFANYLNVIKNKTVFEASDGIHEAFIKNDLISLKMNDVSEIKKGENFTFMNTGSPHHVEMVDDLVNFPVKEKGEWVRFKTYGNEGANVNFVYQLNDQDFRVRTYERGVEDETLSCGTGVTAVAIAMYETNKTIANNITLHTEGGILEVRFIKENEKYTSIYLSGPAQQVFKGVWQ
ncbi:MAG: diaminopimelate epimerase [Flavobacteriaceae bacterium]